MMAEQSSDLRVQQNVIRNLFLLHFVAGVLETSVWFYSLGYLVAGSTSLKQCQLWVLSPRVGLQSKQTLVTPPVTGPPLHSYVLQTEYHCTSKGCGWVGDYVSLLAEYLPVVKMLECRGEGSVQVPVDFSAVSEFFKNLQQRALAVRLGRAICILGLSCLWIPMALLHPTSSVKFNLIVVLEASFSENSWSFGALSPQFFSNFIQTAFIYVYILGSF